LKDIFCFGASSGAGMGSAILFGFFFNTGGFGLIL
jgi:hypothetical protein